jgi:hypothetical protein
MKTENKAPIPEKIGLAPWVIALASLAFVGVQTLFYFATRDNPPPFVVRILLIPFAGLAVAFYILVAAYVNRDSKRRGMNSLLWTLLVIFIPNGIGFIIYFLTRQPLLLRCPQCSSRVKAGFNFCPKCNYQLAPACPKCHRSISPGDAYCPYCGEALGATAP